MELKKIYKTIQKDKESVLEKWVNSESISPILENINVDVVVYKNEIASSVLDYFLGVLSLKEKVGDCPVMRRIVETFLDSGLHVEDVFSNCTIFKNIIVETLYEHKYDKESIREVTTILDTNLKMLLGVYTQQMIEKDNKSKFHAKLIEEHVALSITDTKGIITYVTDAFCSLTGYDATELIGQSHQIIRHPDMSDKFFKGMWEKMNENHTWKGKIINRKKDGGEFIAKTDIIPFIDKNGTVVEYVAIRHDITDKELSNTDPLTGLYNRRYYKNVIKNVLNKSINISLMIIDIDHFKKINDSFGHNFGDIVLKQFASILTKKTRGQDICIRWGGEEFLILLPEAHLQKASEIAERVRKSIEDVVIFDNNSNKSVDITCSIGVTQCYKDDNMENFINRADSNLYTAKNNGRNMVVSN